MVIIFDKGENIVIVDCVIMTLVPYLKIDFMEGMLHLLSIAWIFNQKTFGSNSIFIYLSSIIGLKKK